VNDYLFAEYFFQNSGILFHSLAPKDI